ncbi:hypothetical protein ABGN05_16620 [Aquibium sp. LZ166]|uniref:Pyruvate carboxyltransferase domain-containing protein n=1 Tax=Aquibium pacificus TaxID=3153579 RepID=A0ABV3SKQ0_9HYPH
MNEIKIIDTTLRDGQQSLWALNMRTGVMLTALERLDEAGYEAMEFYCPAAQIKKMVRDLGEDPFQWLHLGMKKLPKTTQRLHGGYKTGIGKVPECISKLLVQKVIDRGITVTRISDPWNDFESLRDEHDTLRAMGMESVINLIYSISPRHTEDYFIERVRNAVALKPYRLCFKDVGGLLTPQRLAILLPRVQEAAGDIPIEFHNHCNNGLGPFNALEASRLGVRYIHTAVPPLANASSQPSVFNVVHNLRALGYDVALDEEPLRKASQFLTRVAERDGLAIGAPVEYDQSMYSHQIPGGMISNLRYQLSKVGMEHRLDEIRVEAAQVRADLGYPIMVTPLSQFVGTQAAINVITGERYGQVTDETIQFALGHWGREALQHMDPTVRDRILNRPRARELDRPEPSQPNLAEVRAHYGESLTDEELIIRAYVDQDAVEQVRRMPTPMEEPLSSSSLVDLVAALSRTKGRRHISIRKGDLSVTLRTAPADVA